MDTTVASPSHDLTGNTAHIGRETDIAVETAYEWLDAQQKSVSTLTENLDLAYLASHWSGREIAESDIIAASRLHRKIHGKYPFVSIDPRLTLPSAERIIGKGNPASRIDTAQVPKIYGFYEIVDYSLDENGSVIKSFVRKKMPKLADNDSDYCLTHDCACYYCVYGR